MTLADTLATNDAIETKARAIIVRVLEQAARRSDDDGYFADLADLVDQAAATKVPSWVALDAVILALGGRVGA